MAAAQNKEDVERLQERVDELEDRVRDLEIQTQLPWPLRLIGYAVDRYEERFGAGRSA